MENYEVNSNDSKSLFAPEVDHQKKAAAPVFAVGVCLTREQEKQKLEQAQIFKHAEIDSQRPHHPYQLQEQVLRWKNHHSQQQHITNQNLPQNFQNECYSLQGQKLEHLKHQQLQHASIQQQYQHQILLHNQEFIQKNHVPHWQSRYWRNRHWPQTPMHNPKLPGPFWNQYINHQEQQLLFLKQGRNHHEKFQKFYMNQPGRGEKLQTKELQQIGQLEIQQSSKLQLKRLEQRQHQRNILQHQNQYKMKVDEQNEHIKRQMQMHVQVLNIMQKPQEQRLNQKIMLNPHKASPHHVQQPQKLENMKHQREQEETQQFREVPKIQPKQQEQHNECDKQQEEGQKLQNRNQQELKQDERVELRKRNETHKYQEHDQEQKNSQQVNIEQENLDMSLVNFCLPTLSCHTDSLNGVTYPLPVLMSPDDIEVDSDTIAQEISTVFTIKQKSQVSGKHTVRAMVASTGQAPGLPHGWLLEKRKRQSGKLIGREDSYWYSPRERKQFRSMREVRTFLHLLGSPASQNNEGVAYKLFKKHKNLLKPLGS